MSALFVKCRKSGLVAMGALAPSVRGYPFGGCFWLGGEGEGASCESSVLILLACCGHSCGDGVVACASLRMRLREEVRVVVGLWMVVCVGWGMVCEGGVMSSLAPRCAGGWGSLSAVFSDWGGHSLG